MAKIRYWEDEQPGSPYGGYMAERRALKGLPPAQATMQVNASMNWGLWIVNCPGGCGDDVMASNAPSDFSCSMPACPAIEIYEVVFPKDYKAIEREMLKRPLHPSGILIHANFSVGETFNDIKAENAEHGVM